MILYTVIPIETVLEGLSEERSFVDVQIGNVTLVIEPISLDEAIIVRMISTNPYDYLNPSFSPGRSIHMSKISSYLTLAL